MGRPRMSRDLPKYASRFTDNRGAERIRLRRTGWHTQYVQSALGSPAFTSEYHNWLENGRLAPGEDKVTPGSFDDLIAQFYRSQDFRDLSKSTQKNYRGILERFRKEYGDRPAKTMQARHIAKLLSGMSDRPSAANNLRKRLCQLFDFAILLNWRTDNPARPVKALKTPEGGFKTWQETEIARYEAAHPVGTKARLLFDLALYTAQRRSDLAVMGPQHIEQGRIRVRQLKTNKTLLIPIHPRLAESIAATDTGHFAFVAKRNGNAYTKESLGNWFRDQCTGLNLEDYSLHGLRKAASRRMAEVGLSNQLIKSITGHVTDSEVARYTRDAEQQKMADLAIESLASSQIASL